MKMLRFNKYWPLILGAGLCTMLWGGCSTRNVYVIDGDRSETVDAPQDELPRGVSVSDASVFVKPLSRYGTWHHHHRYGQVFAPGGAYLTARWRPYTHGHWEYTEWGWTWVSADPFGWATDHYGRWTYDAHLGWVWVPGRVWGPAWVTWRHGGGYVGWAPLPPGAQLGAHYGVHETAWVFVHSHHLGTHHVHTLIVYDHHHSHYIRLTRRSQQTNQIGNHRLYRGPDPDEVQRRGGHVVHRSIRETEEEHRLLRDPSGHSLSRDDSSRGGGRSSEDTEQRSGSHGIQRDDDRRTGRDDHGSSNEREQRADRDRHGPSVTEAGTPGSEAPLRRDGRDSNSEDTDRTARETQDSDRTSTEDHVTDQEQRREARSGQRVQDTSHPADGRPELEPTSAPERASGSEHGSNTSRSDTGASSERETARDGVFENAPPAQNRPSVRDTSTSPGADRETLTTPTRIQRTLIAHVSQALIGQEKPTPMHRISGTSRNLNKTVVLATKPLCNPHHHPTQEMCLHQNMGHPLLKNQRHPEERPKPEMHWVHHREKQVKSQQRKAASVRDRKRLHKKHLPAPPNATPVQEATNRARAWERPLVNKKTSKNRSGNPLERKHENESQPPRKTARSEVAAALKSTDKPRMGTHITLAAISASSERSPFVKVT